MSEIELRFWSKVNKQGPLPKGKCVKIYPEIKATRCWIWTAAINDKGYGQFTVDGETISAHRFAFILRYKYDPIKCVLHKCDTPKCVRWLHHFTGTRASNIADMVSKDRHSKGLKHSLCQPHNKGDASGNCKITDKQVLEIRKLYNKKKLRQIDLAKIFNVTPHTIYMIVSNKARI